MSWVTCRLQHGGGAGASSGGLSPTLNLDFTSALPGQVTFTRAGSANSLVSGLFTTVGANVPAIESTTTKPMGLRLGAAATNIIGGSNQFTNVTYWAALTAATVAAGTTLGPDGASMAAISETTANSFHYLRKTIAGGVAGQPMTFSIYARRPAGVTRFAFGLRLAPQFNNAGAQAVFRYDGTMFYYGIPTDSAMSNVSANMVDLGGGMYLCSITATPAASGSLDYVIHSVSEASTSGPLPQISYVGTVGQGPEISCAQATATTGAAGYVDNPTATTNSIGAEAAIFNDISWLNTSVGTFVVEHDCVSGTVIGSGTNTIFSATGARNPLTGTVKTALAWDGSGSDLVNNGGPTTAGGVPTFGADVRLLATSATSTFGHIKSIKYYPQRLTVVQCQALTAPTSTAQVGALRAATRSCLPSHFLSSTGTSLAFVARVPATILGGDRSELRVDFANFAFPGTPNTNAVVIDGCALERVTGVAETVLFKFGGLTAVTLAAGAINVVSDALLPSQFTGLSKFNSGDVYYLRVYYHVTTTAFTVPTSRSISEANTTFWEYDSGATAPDQPITATGPITFAGTHIASTAGLAPVLVGKLVSGDAKTAYIFGDSRVEGVSGSGGNIVGYTFLQKACDALNIPSIAYCQGGSSQVTCVGATQLPYWTPYFAYTRVLIDEMGTNDGNRTLQFADYWKLARSYGIDKIVHAGLSPSSTSTDNWATAVNQTASRAYPSTLETTLAALAQTGQIDTNQLLTSASVRDASTPAKWNSNGTGFAYTQDGLHQSVAGDNAMSTEVQPALSALVLT